MATLSSSWAPAASSANRASSLVDRSRFPFSRPSSPSPHAGESATSIAWKNALNSYRKSLSEKDFKSIMIPAGPEDVANEVEKWQCRQSASRYARVAAAVRAGVGRMQRFSASIDMLAQGSPSPGCLLWGSIKFVLTVGISLHPFQLVEIGELLRSLVTYARCGSPFQNVLFSRQGFDTANIAYGILQTTHRLCKVLRKNMTSFARRFHAWSIAYLKLKYIRRHSWTPNL